MSLLEGVFLWAAVGGYVLSTALFLGALIFLKRFLDPLTRSIFGASFLFHTGAIASRWAAAGHAPVMGFYENSLAGAWFVSAVTLGLGLRLDTAKKYGGLMVPVVLFLLGRGIMSHPELEPLAPPY